MKRRIFSLILAGLLALGTVACTAPANSNPAENLPDTGTEQTMDDLQLRPDVEEPTETLPQEKDAETLRSEIIDRSLCAVGNTQRLLKAMEKGAAGETVTMCYLGGSITQGMNASPVETECYAALSAKLFGETYCMDPSQVRYVNAGIAGTPSTLGVIRVKDDILAYEPDIVFVEFAVNDGGDIISKNAYESLMRILLESETSPAVILIFTVTDEGYTCKDYMSKVGDFYDLGMVSVYDGIWPAIIAGEMTFLGDYGSDGAHPNNTGHRLIADMIGNYFEAAAATAVSDYVIPETTYGGACFEHLVNLEPDSEEIVSVGDFGLKEIELDTYSQAWYHSNDGGNESFIFRATFSKLLLAYKQEKSKGCGKIEIYIDGEPVKTVDGYLSSAWGNAAPELIFNREEAAEHTVEIRMAEDSLDKHFTILDLAYTE